MPRPGPRPYECVRRSWHSDRHQSIRGSIIQQIFRVVHENHSTSTKKNREWQEKLPLVVLKSEEIMYSKANSEAEYIDPDTLWDRVNDAINTIIRKDESIETGEFLPPCVEAALNLGCVPERTSRSQRNSNTRSYLSPRNQAPDAKSPKTIDTRNQIQISTSGPSFYPPLMENQASVASSSVYPLYYGVHFQPRNPITGFQTTHEDSNRIIVGKPVFQTGHERLPLPFTNFSGFNLNKTVGEEQQPPSSPVECDLSLRLGLVSSSYGCGKGLTLVNDVDSGQKKEFSFFPLNSEGEHVENLAADVRKRKAAAAAVNNAGGDGGRRWWQLEPDINQKRRGL
ncbi:uncharacterized protein LOC111878259 [Lactuca sativa]|uniref:Uncharacterized protein n=1 Tax=Lactuca sativa TaxID=4236 RepID=A0A9R1UMK4_LACSA|nr:uncharacterized protein LOC111878259 [Lactuca sativa]KAJ0190156.1 hypothetical protein LSAT_V11C800413280 [Lactuca sativa]